MASLAYKPEKRFFTEQDFAQMTWRDNPIHAIAFGPGPDELTLDIDYIFKAEVPASAARHPTYWVSPATLVFEGVLELNASYKAASVLTLVGLEREPVKEGHLARRFWRWRLNCIQGEMSFLATGYRQFIRRPPELVSHVRLDAGQRGGYDLMCPKR